WSDDATALAETVEYLAALGHRRIARVGGLPNLLHTEIRTDAFAAVSGRLRLARTTTVAPGYTGAGGRRAPRPPPRSARRAADRDHLRQRRHGGCRPGRGPGDGARGAGGPVDRGVGRLAAVPGGTPVAHRAEPRHPRVRRARGAPAPRSHLRHPAGPLPGRDR